MASVLETFTRWKEFLAERVNQAQHAGMSNEAISNLAFHIGQYLHDKIDPQNKEERLLKEMWDVADDEERHTMARLMVKLVDNT